MTLTEASYWTRRLGVVVGGGFLLLLFFVFVVAKLLNPTPGADEYLSANFRCTQTKEEFLSNKLSIPTLQLAGGSEAIIEIDTPTGTLGNLPLVANVYKFDDPGPSLSAQDKAKDIAKSFGFEPEALNRRGTLEYYWNEDDYGRRLTVNANSLNFTLETNYNHPNAFPEEAVLPSNEQAASIATAFLRGNGWLLEDYGEEEPAVTLINVEPDGSFSMAKSRADAELIRIDFYRSKPFITLRADLPGADELKTQLERNYSNYESVTSVIRTPDDKIDVYSFMTEVFNTNTQKSNISVYIGPSHDRKDRYGVNPNVYEVDYNAWVLEEDPCGLYPLLSATAVTDAILQGNASLVYLNEKNGDTVIPYQAKQVTRLMVKDVRLGYLDTAEKQDFLQPIYIVIGEATLSSGVNGTFYYYIPAIDYANLQNAIPEDSTSTAADGAVGNFTQ